MASGKRLPCMARSGYPLRCKRAGHPTATVIGHGSNLGDGLGWMMLPGDLRLSTMDAGSTGTAVGAGLPGPSDTGTPITLRPWGAGSEEGASEPGLGSAGGGLGRWMGIRWLGTWRMGTRWWMGAWRRIRKQRLSSQRQRHQYAYWKHQ